MENPELIFEWASTTQPDIKAVMNLCARVTNQGWTVYGVYPVQARSALGSVSTQYDVLVVRQRPLTEEEITLRDSKIVQP
jgi:hypothetical protein